MDYWGGYSGTHTVPPAVAARWLSWASVNIAGARELRPLGVKTTRYTDPNRQIAGEPLYTSAESPFAHDCFTPRFATSRRGKYLMDPHADSLRALWRSLVTRYSAEGHFDAIFEDDADDVEYTAGLPCRFQAADWQAATLSMQRELGFPVIYNGLSIRTGSEVSAVIGLNSGAIGGTMEECYAESARRPESGGADWLSAENTELRMASEHKLFFCLALDPSEAASALQGRMFVYASFLLGYDPDSSVLWEIYHTPSAQHVMPEVQLVPAAPGTNPETIGALRASSGEYRRTFGSCRLAGKDEGPCIVLVNPDDVAHRADTFGYGRRLELSGAGVLDGGRASIAAGASSDLAPLSAEILFK